MLLENKDLMLLDVRIFLLKNNTLNEVSMVVFSSFISPIVTFPIFNTQFQNCFT